MERRLLYSVAALAMMLGSSTQSFAQNVETQNRFLVKSVTLGSQMGDVPEDLDSKREYYYYNTDNKLVGSSTFGRKYTDEGYYIIGVVPLIACKCTVFCKYTQQFRRK